MHIRHADTHAVKLLNLESWIWHKLKLYHVPLIMNLSYFVIICLMCSWCLNPTQLSYIVYLVVFLRWLFLKTFLHSLPLSPFLISSLSSLVLVSAVGSSQHPPQQYFTSWFILVLESCDPKYCNWPWVYWSPCVGQHCNFLPYNKPMKPSTIYRYQHDHHYHLAKRAMHSIFMFLFVCVCLFVDVGTFMCWCIMRLLLYTASKSAVSLSLCVYLCLSAGEPMYDVTTVCVCVPMCFLNDAILPEERRNPCHHCNEGYLYQLPGSKPLWSPLLMSHSHKTGVWLPVCVCVSAQRC